MAPTTATQSENPPAANTTDVDQSVATPISSPSCQLSDQVLATSYATEQGPMSPDAILQLLRNQVCNDGLCQAPQGIDPSAVVVARDDVSLYKKCEISVGLANGLEGYVFRQTEPFGELQNECSTSIDNMIDDIGTLAKACWWVGTHTNQVYQAGFRSLNPTDSSSLHMQQHIAIAGTLADASPPGEVQITRQGSTPKQVIPIVVGVAVGVLCIAIGLVIFLIWRRNKRERQRWRAALERRARRKARKHTPGHGNTTSAHSTTLLGSLTSGNKSWNLLGTAHNQTAALPPEESQSTTATQENEKIPVNDDTVAAGLHDEAIARRLQRKYDAAHERNLQASHDGNGREERVLSPQPPNYDAVNAGNAMDMVQGPMANRVSHFAPALSPDRCRFSSVTREDEPPPPPPPPLPLPSARTTDGVVGSMAGRRDSDEYIIPPEEPRKVRNPNVWRGTGEDRRHYVFPPQRPLPKRPLPERPAHSPVGWRDTIEPIEAHGVPGSSGVRSPRGWKAADDE
ncbi:hypothetical protein CERZMDRAFT_99160 [Cercospora zeae-maydis SCOH1-5]|uniref:Uncharacterized protein n=1 Tax=Cercospora zeae-maydis SCOH1-5 TaxID=717836 RepID=A0A6A6FAS1_9PEZI|nr:hypothetical protein CERZMDRAFT_99160 [Cercospora zeae-maydis SCOH1-5]